MDVKLSLMAHPQSQFLTIRIPQTSSARLLSPLLCPLSHGTLLVVQQFYLA